MIQVEIEESARRDLAKLELALALKIQDKLAQFERHPEPHKWLKKLKAYQDIYRLHIGRDWVAVGHLQGDKFLVRLIGKRSTIYEILRRR